MQVAYFDNIEKEILALIKSSAKSIEIAVSWFTNATILDALVISLSRNVIVSIITNDDEINNNSSSIDFESFIQAGGNLYFIFKDYFLHHKFMIVDGEVVLTGSYNFTNQAEKSNIENVVVVKNSAVIANQYIEEYNKLEKSSNLINSFIPIDRAAPIQLNFQKPPHAQGRKSFRVTEIRLDKNFIKLMDDSDIEYYMNTNKDFMLGDSITLIEPVEIVAQPVYKNNFVNMFRWIKNPRFFE